MAWSDSANRCNQACLRVWGEPITYTPDAGAGAPFPAFAILMQPQVEQSSSPGYFGSVEVDPLVVTNAQRDDLVTWKDGVTYIVTRVTNPPYGLVTLMLHRQSDPDFNVTQ